MIKWTWEKTICIGADCPEAKRIIREKRKPVFRGEKVHT